jgi:hypothetical protein
LAQIVLHWFWLTMLGFGVFIVEQRKECCFVSSFSVLIVVMIGFFGHRHHIPILPQRIVPSKLLLK